MKLRALVVVGCRKAFQEVQDRVESLGDEAIHVQTQKEALKALGGSQRIDYIILDLEIAVAKGRRARTENGLTFIRKVRSLPQTKQIPVVAMVRKELACEQLTNEAMWDGGANDVVHVPLPEKGFTLELRITSILERRGVGVGGRQTSGGVIPIVREPGPLQAATHPPVDNAPDHSLGTPDDSRDLIIPRMENIPARMLKPFPGGELKFYQCHTTLAGVRLCARGLGRGILEELAERSSADGYRALSGSELAKRLNCSGGQNAIACAVRDLRKKVSERLLAEAGWVVGPRDLIESGGAGYRFSEKVRVGVVG